MDENVTVEPGQADGQPAEGAGAPTQTGPEPQTGQSAEPQGTTDQGTQDVVFDPQEFSRLTESLPPELQNQAKALQKNLQSAYTKKFQDIAQNRKKIEAYDAFSQDPATQLQRMAQQYGYKLTKAQAQDMADSGNSNDWEPKNWDEVMSKAEQRILEKLQPVFSEVQNIKKSSIENQLSEIDPSWQTYESQMMDNLKTHPTLANDPSMLYRLSVPAEVLESRATQKALAKMKAKTEGGKVAAKSSTSRTQPNMPDKAMTFEEAVKAAKQKLADEGITQ